MGYWYAKAVIKIGQKLGKKIGYPNHPKYFKPSTGPGIFRDLFPHYWENQSLCAEPKPFLVLEKEREPLPGSIDKVTRKIHTAHVQKPTRPVLGSYGILSFAVEKSNWQTSLTK